MEQIGRVINLDSNMAEVQVYRMSGCGGNCAGCKGCGEATSITVKVKNEENARVGQMVAVGSSTKGILLAAFITYGIPTILLIATCAIVYYATLGKQMPMDADLLGIISGFAVLVVYFIGLKLADKKIMKSKKFDIEITKILG